MTPQEILELVRAGYTKAEISALTAPVTPAQETTPTEEIVQSADTGTEILPTESVQDVQDSQKTEAVDYSKAIEELKNSIAQLTRTVQNNNIINKTATEQAQVESVDDILKKLIS